MSGFKTLKEGQKVQFEVTQGPKGKQASNIQAAGETRGLIGWRAARSCGSPSISAPGDRGPALFGLRRELPPAFWSRPRKNSSH